MKESKAIVLPLVLVVAIGTNAEDPAYQRIRDVIYGRKHGMALTMDVFMPKQDANGAALIWVVSGGWLSSREDIKPEIAARFVKRGYTVFEVVHGSQPRFTIPEIVDDVVRAVRFIRAKGEVYGIDPMRLGMVGASAGGHLSLMLGTAGAEGNQDAADPIDRVSSRVQAVGCFFPHTDFLNWGKQGNVLSSKTISDRFKPAMDFHEYDRASKLFMRVESEERIRAILKRISPITFVNDRSAPTLIIHGDADVVVPMQQSERIIGKLKAAGVPAKLILKAGGRHGWAGWGDIGPELDILADWFDKYLAKVRHNGMTIRTSSKDRVARVALSVRGHASRFLPRPTMLRPTENRDPDLKPFMLTSTATLPAKEGARPIPHSSLRYSR